MIFSSIPFLYYFLPAVLAVYFLAPRRGKNAVLLLASLAFYGWGEPKLLLLMVFTIVVFYLCGLAIGRSQHHKKAWLTLSIAVGVGLLGLFKYADFFVASVNAVTGLRLPLLKLALPVGISFYTFQCLSYTVDVYRGTVPPQKNPISFGAYVALFPQLIAGPIVRYSDVAKALDGRTHSWENVGLGLRRFLMGLAKKVILADNLAMLVKLYRDSGSPSVAFAWLYAIAFTLNIYFDFSGYSDMAIGLGRIFGFHFPENFDYPYLSKSITEFWRRWHKSLGSWFRDYVYIPLGGNRKGTARTVLNMLIVWSLTGLWHGASWNFVAWGAYYGLLLILERFVLSNVLDRLPGLLRWALTFVIVMVGWVLFYYTDFANVAQHVLSLIGLEYSGGGFHAVALSDAAAAAVLRKYTVYPLLAFVLSLPVLPWLKGRLSAHEKLSTALQNLGTVSLLAVSLLFLVGQSYNPFIYFRF